MLMQHGAQLMESNNRSIARHLYANPLASVNFYSEKYASYREAYQ